MASLRFSNKTIIVYLTLFASEPKEKPEIESYDDLEADGNRVASEVEESAVRIDNTQKFTEATKYRMRQWSEDDRLRAIEYLQWLPDYHLKKLPIESTTMGDSQEENVKQCLYAAMELIGGYNKQFSNQPSNLRALIEKYQELLSKLQS